MADAATGGAAGGFRDRHRPAGIGASFHRAQRAGAGLGSHPVGRRRGEGNGPAQQRRGGGADRPSLFPPGRGGNVAGGSRQSPRQAGLDAHHHPGGAGGGDGGARQRGGTQGSPAAAAGL